MRGDTKLLYNHYVYNVVVKKMSKAQIAVCLEMDHIELLTEIRTTYHLKNLSKAVEVVIKQWQMFIEEKQREKLKAEPVRKPSNPMVNL